ncbi:MAG TPA: rod shape-determining protein MreD, partial [Bacteroidales bacterium]|nr:rod shape-determining protein MreD [Bacteroidales bacterium]
MTNLIFRNILRFVVLILFQVLVFNNIQVFSYITPYIYILFILLLPFETPRWMMLVSGFMLGLMVDFFSNTGGIHTAATVLIAYLRPWAQNTVSSRQEYEPGIQPGIKNLGFRWFFLYSLILTTIHHVFLFYLEVFRFAGFFNTMLHALLNVLYTLV